MATILDYGRLVVDVPSKVGDLGMRPTVLEVTFPLLPGGRRVWGYTVPTGYKLRAKELVINFVSNPMVTLAPGTVINAGTAKVRLGGVDKVEFRVHAFLPLSGTPGGDDLQATWHNENAQWNLQNGITVTSGDLVVTVTPAAADAGLVYFATVFSKIAGVPSVSKGKLVAIAATADQAIVTHSPGSDSQVLGVYVEAVTTGANIIRGGHLRYNGAVIAEFGDCGNDATEPCFMGDDYPTQGCWSIPLWGMEFQQGEMLELYVQPVCDADAVICVQLTGTTTAYGGASAGGVARSRVMARS